MGQGFFAQYDILSEEALPDFWVITSGKCPGK